MGPHPRPAALNAALFYVRASERTRKALASVAALVAGGGMTANAAFRAALLPGLAADAHAAAGMGSQTAGAALAGAGAEGWWTAGAEELSVRTLDTSLVHPLQVRTQGRESAGHMLPYWKDTLLSPVADAGARQSAPNRRYDQTLGASVSHCICWRRWHASVRLT